jgi:hypothetical protein
LQVTFGITNTADVSLSTSTEVDGISFNASASASDLEGRVAQIAAGKIK